MKKQSLVKGSLILGFAGIFSKFLGLFFRWPLIMLIGDEGVGYYQMTYPLYMFFVAMASGVPIAISKMISENNVNNKFKDNYAVVKEANILMCILGIGTSGILFLFAKPIVNFLGWDSKAYLSLIGISFAPCIISILTVYRGFFQGYQNMTPSALSQILEQAGRVVFGVGLAIILLPYGIEFSAGGAASGAAFGGGIACLFLYKKYKKIKKIEKIEKVKTNPKILSKILKISIPISIGTTVGSIMSLIDSILVPQNLLNAGFTSQQSTILYSQLTGKASVIVNIPLTLSMAICASIIPIIAEVYILNNKKEIQNKINLISKLSAVISIPCLFGLYFLAEPILKLIFPGHFHGAEILKYLSLSIPFITITQTSTSILQGIGRYIIPVINLLIGCIIKIILTTTLVSNININIYGAVIASISAYATVAILNLLAMKLITKVKLNMYNNYMKPAFASSLMMIFVINAYNFFYKSTLSNGVACLLSISIGVIIYFIGIILLKVFTIDEIRDKINKKFTKT